MYVSYDTRNFTEEDYEKFAHIPGLGTRQSGSTGSNRGKLVCRETLMVSEEEFEDLLQRLSVEGVRYQTEPSAYQRSAATLVRCQEQSGVQPTDHLGGKPAAASEDAVPAAIQLTLEKRGFPAALSLLSDLTDSRVLTKGSIILSILEQLLAACPGTGFHIFDLYRAVRPLKELYLDNTERKAEMQAQFDKLVTGQLRLPDVPRPFDRLYLKGLGQLLNQPYSEV